MRVGGDDREPVMTGQHDRMCVDHIVSVLVLAQKGADGFGDGHADVDDRGVLAFDEESQPDLARRPAPGLVVRAGAAGYAERFWKNRPIETDERRIVMASIS